MKFPYQKMLNYDFVSCLQFQNLCPENGLKVHPIPLYFGFQFSNTIAQNYLLLRFIEVFIDHGVFGRIHVPWIEQFSLYYLRSCNKTSFLNCMQTIFSCCVFNEFPVTIPSWWYKSSLRLQHKNGCILKIKGVTVNSLTVAIRNKV